MTKIKYRLANGKTIEVEVTEEQAEVITKTVKKSENNDYKHFVRKTRETSLEHLNDEYGWEPQDDTVDVQREVIRLDEAQRLRRAVACLTDKQQLLVRLCYFEGKEFQEVAEMLGVSKAAVSQQFKTIYGQLKRILENF